MNNNTIFEENNYEQPTPDTSARKKKANRLIGLMGAFLGSLAGVILWIILDQLGFIAGLSGVVMLTMAFKGYKFLGETLDRLGMILCVLIAFLMIFVSINISFLITVFLEIGIGEVRGVHILPMLFLAWTDPGILPYFLKNLAIGYGLFLLSGFSHIKGAFQGRRVE